MTGSKLSHLHSASSIPYFISDVEQKPALRGKRMCYTRQRTQRSSFKRRKLFDHCPVSPYDGGIYGEGLSKMSENSRIKLETDDSHATLCGGLFYIYIYATDMLNAPVWVPLNFEMIQFFYIYSKWCIVIHHGT